MPGMLPGSLEERNRVMALVKLEILMEFGVLFVNEELEVRKLLPHPQAPVRVNRIFYGVVYLFCLQNETVVQI